MKNLLILFTFISQIISGKSISYLVPNIVAPQQIIWSNPTEIIFVQDERIWKMNVLTKNIENIGKRMPNDFVGIDSKGKIVLCSIEHFLINSKDEYSTIFKINGKELKFFPTIRPIFLNEHIIITVTALDFLEQHYYEIDIASGSIKEIPHPSQIVNNDMYVKKDVFGNIYLNYNPRVLFKTIIIHTLTHLWDLTSQLLLQGKYQIQSLLN